MPNNDGRSSEKDISNKDAIESMILDRTDGWKEYT
jgi:hypothetical protein